MPSHQERREPLPKGYQFGDAKVPTIVTAYLAERFTGDKDYDEYVRKRVLDAIEGHPV